MIDDSMLSIALLIAAVAADIGRATRRRNATVRENMERRAISAAESIGLPSTNGSRSRAR
jgi:type II secretory pathway predicted ATPase ExeA